MFLMLYLGMFSTSNIFLILSEPMFYLHKIADCNLNGQKWDTQIPSPPTQSHKLKGLSSEICLAESGIIR